MKISIFFIAVLFLPACNTSRQTKGDYTQNTSRSNKEKSVNSRKRSAKKASQKSNKTYRGSNEEYLDVISSGSSSNSAIENKPGSANENKTASNRSFNGTDEANAGSANEINTDANNRLTSDLIREADKVIGVKYRYGGTSPQRGFDCSGLTSYIFDKMDIAIPRTSTDQSRTGKRKNFKDAGVGDLVFFGTGSRVTHVGIVVRRTSKTMEVLHSTSSSGVRRDEIFGSKYWSSRALWAIDFKSLNK